MAKRLSFQSHHPRLAVHVGEIITRRNLTILVLVEQLRGFAGTVRLEPGRAGDEDSAVVAAIPYEPVFGDKPEQQGLRQILGEAFQQSDGRFPVGAVGIGRFPSATASPAARAMAAMSASIPIIFFTVFPPLLCWTAPQGI